MATVLAPDNTVRMIPDEQVQAAIQAGGKPVTKMLAPDGSQRWVSNDQVQAAMKSGGQLLPGMPTPQQPQEVPESTPEKIVAGTLDALTNGPSNDGKPLPNPKVAGAMSVADNSQQDTVPNNLAVGALKGGLQTVHTALVPVGKAIEAATGSTSLPTSLQEPKSLQPEGIAENVGAGVEGIGEFMLGDEALKGLSVAERLGLAAKVAKLAESHPVVAKMLEAGMNTLRTGVASGAQSALHGESPVTGAEYGLAGGAIGEGLGAAASKLSDLTPAAKQAAKEAAVSAAQADTAAAESSFQNFTNQGLRNAASQAVESATGKAADDAASLNNKFGDYTFGDASKDIKGHFSTVYDQLRQESKLPEGGNLFDVATNQIKRAKQVLFNPSSVEAAESADKFLKDGEGKLNKVFEQSKLNPQDLKTAQDGWRKASTLEDLHSAVDQAFTEGSASRSLTGNAPELNPKRFVTKLNKSITDIGADRLKDALGDESTKALLDVKSSVDDLLKQQNMVGKLQEAAKAIEKNPMFKSPEGKSSLGAYAGSGVLGAIAHFAGASNPVTAATLGIPATARWLYTHPTQGSKILGALSKAAPSASQALKQVTHHYDPVTGSLIALDQ